MSWPVEPRRGAGPVRLGDGRATVRAAVGGEAERFDHRPAVDFFPAVHVHYGAGDRCVAVEVWPELDPVLEPSGVHLLEDPYVRTVRRLRGLDPLLVVDGDGATSLRLGVALAAAAGVHAPFDPPDSVMVFADGYYGDLFDELPVAPVLLVRDMPFAALSAQLDADDWETVVPAGLPPLMAGEPETAEFRRSGEILRSMFHPVVMLRTLDLRSASDASGRRLQATLPQWAAVDVAAALVDPASEIDVLWGLEAARVLRDPRLGEHAERYVGHSHAAIALSARRALEGDAG